MYLDSEQIWGKLFPIIRVFAPFSISGYALLLIFQSFSPKQKFCSHSCKISGEGWSSTYMYFRSSFYDQLNIYIHEIPWHVCLWSSSLRSVGSLFILLGGCNFNNLNVQYSIQFNLLSLGLTTHRNAKYNNMARHTIICILARPTIICILALPTIICISELKVRVILVRGIFKFNNILP